MLKDPYGMTAPVPNSSPEVIDDTDCRIPRPRWLIFTPERIGAIHPEGKIRPFTTSKQPEIFARSLCMHQTQSLGQVNC